MGCPGNYPPQRPDRNLDPGPPMLLIPWKLQPEDRRLGANSLRLPDIGGQQCRWLHDRPVRSQLQRPCLRDEGLEQRTGRGDQGRVDSGDSLLRGSLDRIDQAHHVGELGGGHPEVLVLTDSVDPPNPRTASRIRAVSGTELPRRRGRIAKKLRLSWEDGTFV